MNDLAGRNFERVDSEIVKLGGYGVREFRDITAFQYAVWALDWHMWRMLKVYLERYPSCEAKAQIEGLMSGPWVSEQGIDAEAHLQRLIDALSAYEDHSSDYWVKKIGGAQLLLPIHVLKEYYYQNRSFSPCPNFADLQVLPPIQKLPYLEGLGSRFGIFLAFNHQAVETGSVSQDRQGRYCSGIASYAAAMADAVAFKALLNTRLQQRNELISEPRNSHAFDRVLSGNEIADGLMLFSFNHNPRKEALIKKYELKNASKAELERGLRKAVCFDMLEDLHYFLRLDLNINAQSVEDGRTALHEAVKNNSLDCIQELLKNGADSRLQDTNGKLPLDYARSQEASKLLELKMLSVTMS